MNTKINPDRHSIGGFVIAALWFTNRAVTPKEATWEDVLAEAKLGGYPIIKTETYGNDIKKIRGPPARRYPPGMGISHRPSQGRSEFSHGAYGLVQVAEAEAPGNLPGKG